MYIHKRLRDPHQSSFAEGPERHDRIRRTLYPLLLHPLLLQDLDWFRNRPRSAWRRSAEHGGNLREDLRLALYRGEARPCTAKAGDDEACYRALVFGAGISGKSHRANDGIGDAGEVEITPPGRGVNKERLGVVAEGGPGRDARLVGWEDGVEKDVAVERGGR